MTVSVTFHFGKTYIANLPFLGYILYMTIEQTVEIPASRRITLEIPPEMSSGKVQVLVTSLEEKTKPEISLMSLRGSCKGLDTLDAYFTRKRADKALEDRKEGRKQLEA